MQDRTPQVSRDFIVEHSKQDPVVVKDPGIAAWEFLKAKGRVTRLEMAYRLQAQDPATGLRGGKAKPKPEAMTEAFRQFKDLLDLGVASLEPHPSNAAHDVLVKRKVRL